MALPAKSPKPAIGISTLLVAVLVISGCAPAYDQLTVGHLEAIRDGVAPESCSVHVKYERQKKASESPAYDGRSVRNMEAACKCLARAGRDTTLLRESCRASIGAYIAYEHAKEK